MAKKIVQKLGDVVPDHNKLLLTRWVMSKIKADEAKREQAELRAEMVALLEKQEPDLEGHRNLEFEAPIVGYAGIQYQRRVSHSTDMDAVIELLEPLGLLDECTTMVRQVDEDAVMNAVYDGRIPEDALTIMFPQKETFAVVVKKSV